MAVDADMPIAGGGKADVEALKENAEAIKEVKQKIDVAEDEIKKIQHKIDVAEEEIKKIQETIDAEQEEIKQIQQIKNRRKKNVPSVSFRQTVYLKLLDEKVKLMENAGKLLDEKLKLRENVGKLQDEKNLLLKKLQAPGPSSLIPAKRVRPEIERVPAETWFGLRKLTKKPRISDDDSQQTADFAYFEMSSFPPMMHSNRKYPKIIERKSYVVIFDQLIQEAKKALGRQLDANLLVTGNPGTGKSRFYLYCIFRLMELLEDREKGEETKGKQKVLEDREEGEETKGKQMPAFQLVLHYDESVHKYVPETKEFCSVRGMEERQQLEEESNVLRLIEGRASTLTGWSGVSILFSSPGVAGLHQYVKLGSARYVLPVWTLEELQQNNLLLEDSLRLDDKVLKARYGKFGGIARSIFTNSQFVDEDLEKAINSFGALDVIEFVKKGSAVRDDHYSHHVLCMVPEKENYLAIYHLDFLSPYICERVIAKVTGDSLRLDSEFAIDHAADHSANTAVLRGRVYENLCHRLFRFRQGKPVQLRCRSLLPSFGPVMLDIPADLDYCRFEKFDEIKIGSGRWMYCQPTSRTFGGLDAFILKPKIASGENDIYCYGLQMTLNESHGIKFAPMNTFKDELKKLQIDFKTEFLFVFVVPTTLAHNFQKQKIETKDGDQHQRPGDLKYMKQYVASVDPFCH